MNFRVPARCSSCRLIFPSGIALSNVINVTFRGNSTTCPRCRSPASIIDGSFDFVGNVLRVHSAPPETIEVIKILQEALREAQSGKPDDEVLANLEKKSPETARGLKSLLSKTGTTLAVGLFLILGGCDIQSKLDWNVLVDQVHTYTTGKAPYPIPGAAQANADTKPKISRQHRRWLERQNKKKQRQHGSRPLRKPSAHPAD